MSKIPKYWNSAKKYLSKKDKIMSLLIKKYSPDESIIGLSSVNSFNKSIKFNPKDFNPLIYEFNFDSKNGQIFRVEGTDYIINIIPKQYK